ncbi:hypothetical protein WN51_03058 [Melipona quadrifasciata]|uniref:Uncharacterized protein n=1 Tax=Melipona quadrifasciata TaxID=166423 RepID=A0A0M8ZY18_9HYME|nr:hypothetical protein WN51_03058 [Melipona quadrifasciata]
MKTERVLCVQQGSKGVRGDLKRKLQRKGEEKKESRYPLLMELLLLVEKKSFDRTFVNNGDQRRVVSPCVTVARTPYGSSALLERSAGKTLVKSLDENVQFEDLRELICSGLGFLNYEFQTLSSTNSKWLRDKFARSYRSSTLSKPECGTPLGWVPSSYNNKRLGSKLALQKHRLNKTTNVEDYVSPIESLDGRLDKAVGDLHSVYEQTLPMCYKPYPIIKNDFLKELDQQELNQALIPHEKKLELPLSLAPNEIFLNFVEVTNLYSCQSTTMPVLRLFINYNVHTQASLTDLNVEENSLELGVKEARADALIRHVSIGKVANTEINCRVHWYNKLDVELNIGGFESTTLLSEDVKEFFLNVEFLIDPHKIVICFKLNNI